MGGIRPADLSGTLSGASSVPFFLVRPRIHGISCHSSGEGSLPASRLAVHAEKLRQRAGSGQRLDKRLAASRDYETQQLPRWAGLCPLVPAPPTPQRARTAEMFNVGIS